MGSDIEAEIRTALHYRAEHVSGDQLRYAHTPRVRRHPRHSRWATAAPLLAAACVAALAIGFAVGSHGADRTSPGQDLSAGSAQVPESGQSDAQLPGATTSQLDFAAATRSANAECIGRTTMTVSDTGFNLAGIEFGVDGGRACFFDGIQWWVTDLSAGRVRTAQLTDAGRIVSQVPGESVTSGRLAWIVTASEVRRIGVTAGGAEAQQVGTWTLPGPDQASATDRVFLFLVPDTGPVTVIDPGGADGSAGTWTVAGE